MGIRHSGESSGDSTTSSKSGRTGIASSAKHSAGSARSERKNSQEDSRKIKALALECKLLSNQSAQTYERLAKDPKLRALEAQLQEAKQ
jgi:hypothetical protein